MREPDACTSGEIDWAAYADRCHVRLSDVQVRKLASAWALAPTEAGETLSAFERELLVELGRRYIDQGPGMVITAAEQTVLDDALRAMAGHAYPAWLSEVRDDAVIGLRPAPSGQEAA